MSVRTPPPLRATYRLQMHGGFGLRDALAVVPYLERLGASHAYSSPILAARPGSTHGYDVTDPCRLNPELGTDADREALTRALRERGMGLLLDIVPNHMAATPDNPYWRDVLTHGQASRFAGWFDIDWHAAAEELRGRVLLPVLGARMAEVLAQGELTLALADGRLQVRYYETVFPVDPRTLPRVVGLGRDDAVAAARGERRRALRALGDLLHRFGALPPRETRDHEHRRGRDADALAGELAALLGREDAAREQAERAVAEFPTGAAGPARMRRFLDRQPYSLVFWRRAAEEINYRRFFNINELVALNTEDAPVFEETHRLLLDWARDGAIDGLRVDHVDGLRDPLGYLRRLRLAVDDRRPTDDAAERFPVLVEKILSPGEHLRREWPVEGTTGYETLNDLEAVFIHPEGFARLERHYRERLHLVERAVDFAWVAREGKRKVLHGSLAADVLRLLRLFEPIARRDARTRDLSRDALGETIVEAIVGMRVYRTYVAPHPEHPASPPTDEDVRRVDEALAGAREQGRADPAALDLLREVLLLQDGDELPRAERIARRRLAGRFEQVCSPATAKGVEDTAHYLYVPLLSRNEVGGEPDRDLHDAVDDLHRGNAERARDWPRALVTTSTHDTKRGADTRARLDVLAELPNAWWNAVQRWRRMNAAHAGRDGRRRAPDFNTEYLLYQTMLGVWPVPDDAPADHLPDAAALDGLRERARAYMEKAVREGKSRSGWVNQNAEFEGALMAFVDALHDPARSGDFLRELGAFARRVAVPGYVNGLARTLLHLTVPGVPDVYQGTELWDFTLVDPDNRRPVDYGHRRRLLDDLAGAHAGASDAAWRRLLAELVARPGDGRIKLLVTHLALRARREQPATFARGDYRPLRAEGARAGQVLAFARQGPDGWVVVAVPRLPMALGGGMPLGAAAWGDTRLVLPEEAGTRWRAPLARTDVTTAGGRLSLAELFGQIPVALLSSAPDAPD